MTPRRRDHGRYHRAAYRAAIAFLRGRLTERATVEWALKLGSNAVDAREAVLDMIDAHDTREMAEPWRTTWRLIEEAWSSNPPRNNLVDAQFVRDRVRSGEHSGSLVSAITWLVAPWLEVKSLSAIDSLVRPPRRIPRTPHDLASIAITSGDLVAPSEIAIDIHDNLSFLMQVFHALDSALIQALDLGERIWGRADPLAAWHLGPVHRVYFVSPGAHGIDAHEPDRHHEGIAPLVKLQFAVADRIKDLSTTQAAEIAALWRQRGTPIHHRMWAAFARDARIATADTVANWLLDLDNTAFWDVAQYPEIAEVRATRFAEFAAAHQKSIAARIRRLPPRTWWPRGADPAKANTRRRMWAARELRRIQVSGADLPPPTNTWLTAALGDFPHLAGMTRVADGFPDEPVGHWRESDPDARYNLLSSTARLRELESALSGDPDSLTIDTRERACDWIKLPSSHVPLIGDLESTGDGGASFPRVWERIGWVHAPPSRASDYPALGEAADQCSRVLVQLTMLHEEAVRKAIGGISHWLSTWAEYVLRDTAGLPVWHKLWPIAVDATNSSERSHIIAMSRREARHGGEHTEMRFDALNHPVGRLVDVFLAACPRNPDVGDAPDWPKSVLRMRDTLMSADGVAHLIVLYRLIESIDFFMRADMSWTQTYLVHPLDGDGHDTTALWNALAGRLRSRNVLRVVGDRMIVRATDPSLSRSARSALVTNLIAECLWASREARSPVVAPDSIQQMIRKLDDEARTAAAHVLRDYVHVDSADDQAQPGDWTPAVAFECSVRPFLATIWPQERSLGTPGVSEAFAALPAATRGAFAAATKAIERFLVPFDCWSLLQLGLRTDEPNCWKQAGIVDGSSARALLTLLDRTIAASDSSVIPHDLSTALVHIRSTLPRLARTSTYRRLEAATRRC